MSIYKTMTDEELDEWILYVEDAVLQWEDAELAHAEDLTLETDLDAAAYFKNNALSQFYKVISHALRN